MFMLSPVRRSDPTPKPVANSNGTFTDCANGFLCVLASSWRLCGSFACVGASCAVATADTAQQATAPATIPNGDSIESTPRPDHPHLHGCPHRENVTDRCGLRPAGPAVAAILAASET